MKNSRGKQTKITKSARGQECTIRIPGYCCGDPETTVLAHLNGGGGGMKNPDYMGAYACHTCHDAVDGRIRTNHEHDRIKLMHHEGVMRTQKILFDMGLLKIG